MHLHNLLTIRNEMKPIKRDLYSKRIQPFINKGVIKVLTGQRRVGKSYILRQLMNEIENQHPKANIIYINKVRGLKKFEIGEKYYFEDLGLRNCKQHLDFSTDINKLIENVVYQYLKVLNYQVYVGKMGDL